MECVVAVIDLDLEAHKLIEAARADLADTQLDIIKRALRGVAAKPLANAAPRRAVAVTERRTGQYLIRLEGREEFAGSQKAAYLKLLRWLAERSPNLIEDLAREQTRRGRRIVARSPGALYSKKGLDHCAEEIADGWWADLNLSRVQKQQRLRLACRLAGVTYGMEAHADL